MDNPVIKNIHDLTGIWKFLPCRFIFYLSLALNYHFGGLNVLGFHLINLGIHLITAVLVWWLAGLTLSTPAMKENQIARHTQLFAFWVGSIFVSHPIQTQGVTYIMQRAASMATLFYVASLCFYIKSRLSQDKDQKHYYLASLISALLAMFTKEIAITLPLMVLLYEFYFFRTSKDLNWKPLIPFLLILTVIPLTMFLTHRDSVNSGEIHGAMEGTMDTSSAQYAMTQCRVLVTYFRLLFIPFNQNADYDYPVSHNLFEGPTLMGFISLILLLTAAVRLFAKYRLVSFSIFWVFLSLLPESSFLPINDVIFEHRLYLPMVGYSMFLVSSLYYLLQNLPLRLFIGALLIVLGCNSILSFQRNKIWKDELTLWNDTVHKSPHKARPFNNRGLAYLERGQMSQAGFDFSSAIKENPRYADAYNNMANLCFMQGKPAEALSNYTVAIKLNPDNAKSYYNRGRVYQKQNELALALSDFNKAIAINPPYATAYYSRAVAYFQLKDYVHAWKDVRQAEKLGYPVNPGFLSGLETASGQEN